MPTIMAAAGLDVPDEVDGVAQQVVDGVSLLSALEDPAAAELHHTQYFEMMGSRSIYHEGWKATTNHISTGVLDEEELADRQPQLRRGPLGALRPLGGLLGGDRPRRRRARAGAAPQRAVGRPRRTQQRPPDLRRPGRPLGRLHPAHLARGSVADVPSRRRGGRRRVRPPPVGRLPHDGRRSMRAPATAASSSPSATGSGATPCTWSDGQAHFTFARSADTLELAAADTASAGRHEITVSYTLGQDGAPGRMVLLVDDAAVDETAVEGMLPVALQHGGAGLRLGRDSGFPVSPRYTPPAPFSGTVHQLRVDTPGARGRTRPTRCAPPARRLRAGLRPSGPDVRVSAPRPPPPGRGRDAHGRGAPPRPPGPSVGTIRPPAGPNGARTVEILVAERPQQGLETGTVRLEERRRSRPACRLPLAPHAPRWPGRCPRPCRRRRRRAAISVEPRAGRARGPRRCGGRTTPTVHPSPGTGSTQRGRRCRSGRTPPPPRWPPRSRPPARRPAHSPWRTPASSAQLLDAPRARGAPVGGGADRQALQQRVHRGRHTVEATEQHDLPVEELGLDRTRRRGPGSASSIRPATPPTRWARSGGSRRAARGPPRSSPRRSPPRRAPPCPRAAPPAPGR